MPFRNTLLTAAVFALLSLAACVSYSPPPTVTPRPPATATPLPPTATPVPSPTPTSDPAAAAAIDVSSADPAHGEDLFNTFQADAGFACSTCHHDDSEDRLIGPGLLNVAARAETRVEGQDAVEYIYISIINPDAYLVDGFTDDLMPENWAEIYSDDDIADIMAYLFTLE